MKNPARQTSEASIETDSATGPEKTAQPVVFLMGPTACGKTDLAASLLDAFDAELISVDAAQIYRGMDIGTAKPTPDFLRRYPHHLIDICDPHEVYGAARFRDDALRLIAEIHARRKLPVLVGGTMFYFAALENGLSELPAADAALREEINAEIRRKGLPAMHAQLQKIDPGLAAVIRPSDAQRIQRALEIHRLSGRPPSEVMAQSVAQPISLPLVKLGLFTADRRVLHGRIEARFARMLEHGLLDEVKTLIATMDNPDAQPAMRIVGYRQVHDYLKNPLTYDAMIDKAVAATRQLAKRQLTWMRQQRNLVWIDATGDSFTPQAHAYLQTRLFSQHSSPSSA